MSTTEAYGSILKRFQFDTIRTTPGFLALGDAPERSLVQDLVERLRSTEYSITDLRDGIQALKQQAADEHASDLPTVLKYWRWLDHAFGACLEQTAAIHEAALERSQHGYCEVDDDDVIAFANAAMLELLPDCRGRPLPEFFGEQARSVKAALRGKGEPGLHRMQLGSGGGTVPVNAEFGPTKVNGRRCGGYAILVNISPFLDAERRAYNASPFGVVQLDPRQRIRFASKKAVEIFGGPESHLLGRKARELFEDLASRQVIDREIEKRGRGVGSAYHLLYRRPADRGIIPLEIRATPEFDLQNRPAGTLIEVRPLDARTARSEIQVACERSTDGPELLEAVLSTIRTIMPFELAAFAIFSPNMSLARIVHSSQQPKSPLPKNATLPISPKLVEWIKGGPRCSPDLDQFLDMQPGALGLRSKPVVQRLIESGYHALLCFPLRGQSRPSAALVLLAREYNCFGEMHCELLEQLGIEEALSKACQAFRRAESNACLYELLKALPAAGTSKDLANEIARGLTRYFQWQHVSIFKVDRARRKFRLLAQEKGPIQGFLLPEEYEQWIKDGVLGLAYHTRKPVIVSDLNDDSDASRRFVHATDGQPTQSELCFPVRLQGRIIWLINLEDRRPEAFGETDDSAISAVLGYIIKELEQALEHRLQNILLETVLQRATDGIVITDMQGRVLRCNRAALEMLQLERQTPRQRRISGFVADPEHGKRFDQDAAITSLKVRLRGERGKVTRVLANAFIPEDDYDRKVFFLKDLEKIELQRDLQAMGAAVAEVAQQARVPLSLAGSFVQRLAQLVPTGELRDRARELISSALRQLLKVELTYDRVLAGYDRARLGPPAPVRLRLDDLLSRLIGELPSTEQKAIRADVPEHTPAVRCDPRQLGFVLQSIIAYLMRDKARSDTIDILVRNDAGDGQAIRISVTGPAPPGSAGAEAAKPSLARPDEDGGSISAADALLQASETARAAVSLGEPAIKAIIEEAHHGTYSHRIVDGRVARFELALPAAP